MLSPYLLSPMTWYVLCIGLCVGSFLNVCIYRIPEGQFWSHKRSVCRHCGAVIPFYLNIPLLSFLFLRGRAKCCGTRISWQYPIVEALTGLLIVLLYWQFPFVETMAGGWGIEPAALLRFGHAAVFSCLLLICAFIDINHMIIPDVISLPMIALTPLVVYLHPDLSWQSALIGLLVGGLGLYVVAWGYWLVRREVGLGLGDVKLLAAIGGWMGYQAIIPTIFIGSVVGAAFGLIAIFFVKRLTLKSAIPFGPFLVLGALAHLLFGNYIQEWFYLQQ